MVKQINLSVLCTAFIFSQAASLDINPELTDCSTLLNVKFENHGIGAYSLNEAVEDFGDSGSSRGFREARAHVVRHGNPTSENANYLRTSQPAGCDTGATCGIRATSFLNSTSSSLTYSYDFRLSEGASFASGGLLPGICSGNNCHTLCNKDGSWAARVKWLPEGQIASYINEISFDGRCGDLYPLLSNDSPVVLEAGRWHNIVQHVKLNSEGKPNGALTTYIDGRLAYWGTTFKFSAEAEPKFDWFVLQAFFTGVNDNENTVFVDFDNLWAGTCTETFIPPTSKACPSQKDMAALQSCWGQDHSVPDNRPVCFSEICPSSDQGSFPPFTSCELPMRQAWDDADAALGYDTAGPECDQVLGKEQCDGSVKDLIFAYCSSPYQVVHGWLVDRGGEETSPPPEEPAPASGVDTVVVVVIVLLVTGIVAGGVVAVYRRYEPKPRELNELVVRMPHISRNPLYIEDGIPVPKLGADSQSTNTRAPLYRKPIQPHDDVRRPSPRYRGKPQAGPRESAYSDVSAGSRVKLHPPSYDTRSGYSSYDGYDDHSSNGGQGEHSFCGEQGGDSSFAYDDEFHGNESYDISISQKRSPPQIPPRKGATSQHGLPSLPRYSPSAQQDSYYDYEGDAGYDEEWN